MSLNTLEEIAEYIVSNGKGILAADESNPTCGKRFDSIGVESTETNRRDYREMLFRATGMQDNIGGVILFDETIRQSAEDGTPLVELIKNQGALPGIKVDKGLAPIESSPEETVTQGLDGLDEISLSDNTLINELKDNKVLEYSFDPRDYGYDLIKLEDIKGGDPEYNANCFNKMINGDYKEFQMIVEINAGAAIYLSNLRNNLKDSFELAKKTIEEGITKNFVNSLINE